MRRELPIWAQQRAKGPSRWKLPTAIMATAALSGIFWTTALPKLKTLQDTTQLAPAPIAPPSVPTNSQQVAEQPESIPSVQSVAENSEEQIPAAPSTANPPAVDANSNRKSPRKTKGRKQKATIISIKRVQTARAIPRVIFADKKESLYQVALEHYGESSSLIVDKILLENPTLQNRYAIVAEGQRIVLPNVPEGNKTSTSLKTGNAKRN